MAAGQQHDTPTTTDRTPRTDAAPRDGQAPAATGGARSGRALPALILGIVSIPAALIPILALILGGVAVFLGVTARKEIRSGGLPGHGQATAGMVLGIVGIVLGIALMVANAVILTS